MVETGKTGFLPCQEAAGGKAGKRKKGGKVGKGRKFMAGSHFVLSAVLGKKNKEEEKQG